MQKLDVNGNQIHSSFSSNDPNAATLTPQRIQQSRRDSQRNREMDKDYFDPNLLEEEYYTEFSAPPISRNHPRPPALGDYSRRSSDPATRISHSHPSVSETPRFPTGVRVYHVDTSQQFETMNPYDIENTIRSTQPWAEYPRGYPHPELLRTTVTSSSYASHRQRGVPPYDPYLDYSDRENEYDDSGHYLPGSALPSRGHRGYRYFADISGSAPHGSSSS
jgi:hypothetical protein